MPYRHVNDLPAPVQAALPHHAQEIYLEAFNHAWNEYAARPDRESLAHRVAWAAVKKKYFKQGNAWVTR